MEKAMALHLIERISVLDTRYPLPHGAGSDAVHTNPEYCFAVTRLVAGPIAGTGIALTLGAGNRLVCDAIELLARPLRGHPMADDPALRWLGPHKGVVHLALASITNACFDLWAKSRGVPLWKLLLDLSPEQVVSLLDLSYLEDVLDEGQALALLRGNVESRKEREGVLQQGYPGYDTDCARECARVQRL
jgi:L-fuconate dehydratase